MGDDVRGGQRLMEDYVVDLDSHGSCEYGEDGKPLYFAQTWTKRFRRQKLAKEAENEKQQQILRERWEAEQNQVVIAPLSGARGGIVNKSEVQENEVTELEGESRTKQMDEDLEALFESLDSDGSGYLEMGELRNKLRCVGGSDAADIELVFNALDTNSDGIIVFNEFQEVVKDKLIQEQDVAMGEMKRFDVLRKFWLRGTCMELFAQFDVDNSGSITLSEMERTVELLGQTRGVEEKATKDVKELFNRMDEDSSGEIDFDEFVTFLTAASGQEVKRRLQAFQKLVGTNHAAMMGLERALSSELFASWETWHEQDTFEGSPEYLWEHPPPPNGKGCIAAFRRFCHQIYSWKHFDNFIMGAIVCNGLLILVGWSLRATT